MNLSRNQVIASVAGTLEVLEVISKLGVPSSLSAITGVTAKPKGTVHRMVSTLVNTGYVAQDSSGRYFLTLKAWQVGSVAVRNLDIVDRARPILHKLGSITSETVHLSVLDPLGEVIYISKVESPKSISAQTRLGQVNPSWCTATGRSILAFKPDIANYVLSKNLEKYTNQTEIRPEKIKKILDRVKEDGYAVTLAENHPDMGGIAAPIRDLSGEVIASCGVAIPAFRMNSDLINKFIPFVLDSASDISVLMGCPAHFHKKGLAYAS